MAGARHRLSAGLAGLAAVAAISAPAAAVQAPTPPREPGRPDFAAILLADPGVTATVKGALRDGSAFAEGAAYGDLTADGRADAVVLVTTPGAAGSVAAYVVSATGSADGSLRVIHRSQRLHRAFVRASRGALVVLTAQYARGDDVCCPAARLQRTYVYDRRARIFRRTEVRRLVRAPG